MIPPSRRVWHTVMLLLVGRSSKARRRHEAGPAVPRTARETFERWAKLFAELHEGTTLDEMIARRRRELRELLSRFDAVHLLGQLIFSEAPMNADTYSESEHAGAAYVVELIAAELILRPGREGTSAITPAIEAHVLAPARELCQEAALLEAFRRMNAAGGLGTAESSARARAASHHLMLRGPGWPWQEHDTLRGLFGPERFAGQLETALGFDAEDAIACSEAVARLTGERAQEHMTSAQATAGAFGPKHPAYQWAMATLGGWQDAGPPELRAHAMTAIWAMNNLGDALLLSGDSLALAACVEPTVASAFLSALAQEPGQEDDDWFGLAESLRRCPFINYGPDGFLPTVVGSDLWALRGVFEGALQTVEAYQRHRGRWLEETAAARLAKSMAPDHLYLSVEYAYDGEHGERLEGEIDALLLCGDAAIVIEAKGATMRPGARRGGEAFIRHLRDNLTKAAEQGTRARQALATPGSIRKDGAPLALPTVREVHPIVVTLDDLSAVAPVLWEFQGTRVMPDGVTIPWVVTLHELDLIAGTIEWPAQFVHFLRRRARLNQIGQLSASDELDWWMHYLLKGLYFEDDADAGPTRLLSHTDPLDAWVLHDRGLRRTPAAKPSMLLDKKSRAFLDLISEERPPGWIPAACALLDLNHEARKCLWKAIDKMRPQARQRALPQRCTMMVEPGPDPMIICAVVVPNDHAPYLTQVLADLVDARVTEHGPQRVLGIGATVASRRPYEAVSILDRSWWEPPKGT